jgi:hypothetical protein
MKYNWLIILFCFVLVAYYVYMLCGLRYLSIQLYLSFLPFLLILYVTMIWPCKVELIK